MSDKVHYQTFLDKFNREKMKQLSWILFLITGGNIKTTEEDYLIRASNRSYYGVELQNLIVRTRRIGIVFLKFRKMF